LLRLHERIDEAAAGIARQQLRQRLVGPRGAGVDACGLAARQELLGPADELVGIGRDDGEPVPEGHASGLARPGQVGQVGRRMAPQVGADG
jgi:hypothetical protein